MAGSAKHTAKAPHKKRRRKRAPAVSAMIALSLIVACIIYVCVRYNRGDELDTEGAYLHPEQSASEQQTATITTDELNSIQAQLPVEYENPPPPVQALVNVRGMYVDEWSIAGEGRVDRYIDICDKSDMNAIVIDIKDDYGEITFSTNNEILATISNGAIPNIERIVSRLKEHGIYTIARLVCFKDPLWSSMNTELAIQDMSGALWKDNGSASWLNPYNKDSWEYIALIAKEAVRLGFNEIQLDYVRFPADGNLADIDFGSAGNGKTKAEAIGEFLDYMESVLADTDAMLSADVFGIIAVAAGDFEGIGQDLDIVLQNVDYVCPMIYPSHFANEKENGVGQRINDVLFKIPDKEPYEVVYNILQMVKSRLPEGEGHAGIRPYLQAFTASYLGDGYYQTYSAQQVLEQIQAVYDAGFDEWILWNQSGDLGVYENVSSLISSENSAGSSNGTPAVNNAWPYNNFTYFAAFSLSSANAFLRALNDG